MKVKLRIWDVNDAADVEIDISVNSIPRKDEFISLGEKVYRRFKRAVDELGSGDWHLINPHDAYIVSVVIHELEFGETTIVI